MRKVAVGGVAALILWGVSFAAQKDSSFTGEITDRACAKADSHEAMMKKHGVQTAADCIPACIKAGGKYVLYDTATKTIYLLDDQQRPAQFAGKNVKVTGTLDKTTETLHVSSIAASS
jgi:type 1 fimbria pilin